MLDFFRLLLSSDFMPHGMCYLWQPAVLWLNVLSDGLIALAYVAIPLTLLYFVHRRRDLPFHWMFLLFGAFILGCSATHVMEVWTVWHGTYRLAGLIKAFTAGFSVATAALLVPLVPKALDLPSPRQLEASYRQLEMQVFDRIRAQDELESQAKVLREKADLLDLANDSIVVLNMSNEVVFWNRGAEEQYGWGKLEAMGKNARTLLQTHFPKPLSEIEAEFFRTGRWEGEIAQTTSGGREITVASRWALQRDKYGVPRAVLEIDSDITERRRAEARFRQLLEAAPDAMVVTSPDGKIVLVNAQTEKLFGYPREELMGQCLELLVPEHVSMGEPGAWESSGDELDLRPSGAGLRFQGRRKDGALFPVEISRSPLETEGTVLVSSAIRDVTWRQQAEEELKARASVLKAQALLLDVTNDPIIVRDLESRVIFWNRGAETTYGWSRLEAVGRVSHKLLQTRFPQPLAEIEAALLNDGYWEGEVDHARRDGSRVVVASRRVVQRDEQGKPWRTLEISNNITEKKRTEERIQAPNAGLANRNAEVARGDDDRGESRDSAGRG